MKSVFVFALTLGLLAGAGASADGGEMSGPMVAPFARVYLPIGFDSNDRSEIIVEGVFPGSCYRVDDPVVLVSQSLHEIRIQAKGWKIDGYCFMMPTPFMQVINLGVMPVGRYDIKTWMGAQTYGTLTVAIPRSTVQDDYMYASVNQASLQEVNGVASVLVSGTIPSGCSKIHDVIISEQTNVIVVQPVLEHIAAACGSPQPFQVSTALRVGLHGRYLIHVRSAAGTAFNTIVNI
jgi:hypothetical protein